MENLTFTLTDRNIAPYVTAGIYAIDQWRQIGVKVQHKQLELAGYTSATRGGDFDVMIDSFTDLSSNPTTGLVKYISAGMGGAEVYTNAKDPKLDELYAEQASTIDPAKRMRIVREFEARAMEKAYAVPLLYWNRLVVMSSRVQGWTISPTHMIYQDLADIWLATEKK